MEVEPSMNEEDIPSPAGISLAGAIAVILVYWVHLALISQPLINENGVSITIFVSAFVAQYIPLRVLKTRLLEDM